MTKSDRAPGMSARESLTDLSEKLGICVINAGKCMVDLERISKSPSTGRSSVFVSDYFRQ